jgi:class III poly(R)-hydroxyalkanoic acid synthase PhaE subunit
MNPFEYMQSLAELWGQGGKGFMAAQQGLFADMAERMTKVPGTEGGFAAMPANFLEAQGLTKANEAFTKLWSSAIEMSQTLTRNMQKGDKPDPLVAEMLGRIFDPRAWFAGTDGMDEALHHLSEGPRLADLWEVERKTLRVFNAWADLRRRSLEHNAVMLEAWMQAAGGFAKTLNEKADRNEVLGSWKQVLALWVETANTALLETQRSDIYLKSQREILKASTDLRLAQQEIAEFYSHMFGYPTRAELDDVHRTVTELRRELRALQRAARSAPKTGMVGSKPKPATAKKARTARNEGVLL